ncbi:prolyl oligopeptidase family serine peptidase [Paenirhodobacter sp.]|uniref:prolyl oligopeptidase family serine peptidase n=1 Tax=Paenirhodobacter sp. TaxID=1965326 RepID=UPI003B3FD8A5
MGANPTYNEPETIGETVPFDVDGAVRRVHLYIPEGATGASVLLLHGANRTGRSMLDMWRAEADRSGTVLIAPDAAGDSWNPEADPPQFLIAALNAAVKKVQLDHDRLFMFGHSSGGLLAQLYANQVPGPWRAVATHGAAVPVQALRSPAAKPVPVRLYLGAGDHLFPPRRGRMTADALIAAGHPVDLVTINRHTHWYYTIGPWIARDCADWFAAQPAP